MPPEVCVRRRIAVGVAPHMSSGAISVATIEVIDVTTVVIDVTTDVTTVVIGVTIDTIAAMTGATAVDKTRGASRS